MAGLALTCLPLAEDLASTWRYPIMGTLFLWEPSLLGLFIIKELGTEMVPIRIWCYPADLDPEKERCRRNSSPIQLT